MRGIKIQRNVSYKKAECYACFVQKKLSRSGGKVHLHVLHVMLEQNVTFKADVIAKVGSKVPSKTLESWLTANRAEIIE